MFNTFSTICLYDVGDWFFFFEGSATCEILQQQQYILVGWGGCVLGWLRYTVFSWVLALSEASKRLHSLSGIFHHIPCAIFINNDEDEYEMRVLSYRVKCESRCWVCSMLGLEPGVRAAIYSNAPPRPCHPRWLL